MADKAKIQRQKLIDKIVIVAVIGIDAYVVYAFCYEVMWRHSSASKGVKIALVTVLGSLNLYLFIAWAAIHVWGPGRTDTTYALVEDEEEPFMCDAQGYALYCSHCRRIKPARTHHSSNLDRCVPVMDHYCIWVGTVIGQGNVKFFLQFVFSAFCCFLVVFVALLRYQHKPLPHISAHAIPLYVLCGFWLVFVGALAGQHIRYILIAQSTLEMFDRRKKRYPYFNIPVTGGRRVIAATKEDLVPGPYTMGPWDNVKSVMGPVWMWFLPVRGPIREPVFNKTLLKRLQERQTCEERTVEKGTTPDSSLFVPRHESPRHSEAVAPTRAEPQSLPQQPRLQQLEEAERV